MQHRHSSLNLDVDIAAFLLIQLFYDAVSMKEDMDVGCRKPNITLPSLQWLFIFPAAASAVDRHADKTAHVMDEVAKARPRSTMLNHDRMLFQQRHVKQTQPNSVVARHWAQVAFKRTKRGGWS